VIDKFTKLGSIIVRTMEF